MLEDLTSNLISKPNNKAKLMYEVAACICAAVDADDFNLYIHETEGQITLFAPQEEKTEAGTRMEEPPRPTTPPNGTPRSPKLFRRFRRPIAFSGSVCVLPGPAAALASIVAVG